jgi:hypothetical protein
MNPGFQTMYSACRRLLAVLLSALLVCAPVASSEIKGRFSLGFAGVLPEGGDSSLRLTSRLQLDLSDVLGSRGSVSLDVEGRQSDTGLSADPLGVREFVLRYALVPDRFEVEAGRVSMPELEGLLVDGIGVRWKLSSALSLEAAGGARTGLDSLYGKPDPQRLGFGLLLRASGKRSSADLGFSELRNSAGMERRLVSGSGLGSIGQAIFLGGHFALDLGQPGQAAHLTSLFAHATLRPARFFDLSLSYANTSGFFPPEVLNSGTSLDLPSELQPSALDPSLRFGPRFQSFSVRSQISPVSALSLFGDARLERDGDGAWSNSFVAGTRLKLDRLDRSALRAEIMRSERPAFGTPSFDVLGSSFWRWKAGARHSFGHIFDVEAYLSQTLRQTDAITGATGPGGLGGEATATLILGRHLSFITYYGLEAASEPRTHMLFTQLSYRF